MFSGNTIYSNALRGIDLSVGNREKDIPDRTFLRKLLAEQGVQVEEQHARAYSGGLRDWLRRTFGSSE